MGTFSDAVRALSDEALVALLRARPDLASPSPSTLRSLAARASSRNSLEQALAHLDTPTLQVLEAVLVLEELGPVRPDDVAVAVGASDPAEVAAVHRLIARACRLMLLWSDDDAADPDADPDAGGEAAAPATGSSGAVRGSIEAPTGDSGATSREASSPGAALRPTEAPTGDSSAASREAGSPGTAPRPTEAPTGAPDTTTPGTGSPDAVRGSIEAPTGDSGAASREAGPPCTASRPIEAPTGDSGAASREAGPPCTAPRPTEVPVGEPDAAPATRSLRAAPGLIEVLGPYPAGFGPATGVDVTGLVAATPLHGEGSDALAVPGAREVLDALAWGPPIGTVPPPRTAARAAVNALLGAGLLAGGEGDTVVLPREVGLALRGGRTHRSPHLAPPDPASARAVAEAGVPTDLGQPDPASARAVPDAGVPTDLAPPDPASARAVPDADSPGAAATGRHTADESVVGRHTADDAPATWPRAAGATAIGRRTADDTATGQRTADDTVIGRHTADDTVAGRHTADDTVVGRRTADDAPVTWPRAAGATAIGRRTTGSAPSGGPATGPGVAAAVVESEAASAAVEAVRLVDTLLRAWQDAPPPVLRAGGLGVRDLKRVAQTLGVPEATAATVVELAAAAGLVDDDGEAPPSYVPTTRADAWDEAETADRWAMLALAWAASRRTPWLAGTRDDKGAVRAALGPDLSRGWVPRLRTQVLTALSTHALSDDDGATPSAAPPAASPAGTPTRTPPTGLLPGSGPQNLATAEPPAAPPVVSPAGTPPTWLLPGSGPQNLATATPAAAPPAASPVGTPPTGLLPGSGPQNLATAEPAAATSTVSAARALLAAAGRPAGLPMTVDDVVADLAWRTPRAIPPVEAVDGLLREAALLGMTGAGVLAPTGRAVLALLDDAGHADRTARTGVRQTGVGQAGTAGRTGPTTSAGNAAQASGTGQTSDAARADSIARTGVRQTGVGQAGTTGRTGVAPHGEHPRLTGAVGHADDAGQADGGDAEALLAQALRAILPEAVDEVLLQGDLTGIVPGRPSRDLAVLIDRAADVESRGAATTVRFTPASVTRALDAGMTGEELLDALAARSRTPVPQPLEYLVHDTARRHAALRVGAVGSYVRAADPAVLTGLVEDDRLADLGLVRLAPTVVASSAPAATLQAALRQRGLLAALEGPDGRPLGRLRRPSRVERGGARGLRSPSAFAGAPTSDDGRRALVERLRIADGAGRRSPFPSTAGGEGGVSLAALRGVPRSRPTTERETPSVQAGTPLAGDALALLREAVRDGGHVWLELVDGHGRPIRRKVRPLKVEAGRLRALDTGRGSELTVAVHRIARVEPDLT